MNCLQCASCKFERVVRSVLHVELYVFADAYDYAFILRYDLLHALQTWIPFFFLPDFMHLLSLLIQTSIISMEKRLMIDVTALRDVY